MLDIRGQLNNIKLGESQALLPLFEAVVNSIQAIGPEVQNGKIEIKAYREKVVQQNLVGNSALGKIVSFEITDNGVGFNEANYSSFNTAYSTYKLKIGGKGIGRFLWLKTFKSVSVDSFFLDAGKCYNRKFMFAEDGISPEKNLVVVKKHKQETRVKLKDMLTSYKQKCPSSLEVIAKKLIEHCLLFFVNLACPKIVLTDDNGDRININEYYENEIKSSLHKDNFEIKGCNFTLYHFKMAESEGGHELHFCADQQDVLSINLKTIIPTLQKKINTSKDNTSYYYDGYLTSDYLNSSVNITRTNFIFCDTDDSELLYGPDKETILLYASKFIKTYLKDDLAIINKINKEQIDKFVYNNPQYKYILNTKPEIYEEIPPGLNDSDLELSLHKSVQKWERELKENACQLDKEVKQGISLNNTDFKEKFKKYCSGISDLNKTSLAEYVVRRKVLLELLEDALTKQENGLFKKEEVIHSIICPMRHTSNDIQFEEMNLWIIDEQLMYHHFLASDKTLKSMPIIRTNSCKEPDIIIFNRSFAYTADTLPINTITIIEFKKPDNKKDNPITQVGKYIALIRAGRAKDKTGKTLNVNESINFRCYIIADLSEKMRFYCEDAGLQKTTDGIGYYGYQPERKAYFEVIPYTKLLENAKRRNQIFFDKLLSPKIIKV